METLLLLPGCCLVVAMAYRKTLQVIIFQDTLKYATQKDSPFLKQSGTMRHRTILLLFVLTGLHFFAIYGFMLVDWVQNFSTGVYGSHHTEAFCETSLLIIYAVLSIHFVRKRIGMF